MNDLSLHHWAFTSTCIFSPCHFFTYWIVFILIHKFSHILSCSSEGREWGGTLRCPAMSWVLPSAILLTSLSSFSSSSSIAEHGIIQYGISFPSVWLSCPGCAPSQHHPSPSHLVEGWIDLETRGRARMLKLLLSNSQNKCCATITVL